MASMNDERTKVRVLLGTDIVGRATVLAADYFGVRQDCNDVSTWAEEIGICTDKDCPRPGLYLFEGDVGIEMSGSPWDQNEPEVTYRGTVRPVHLREIDELFAMCSDELEPTEETT